MSDPQFETIGLDAFESVVGASLATAADRKPWMHLQRFSGECISICRRQVSTCRIERAAASTSSPTFFGNGLKPI
jgi:hypothetical protein